jgi:hypothetical protein
VLVLMKFMNTRCSASISPPTKLSMNFWIGPETSAYAGHRLALELEVAGALLPDHVQVGLDALRLEVAEQLTGLAENVAVVPAGEAAVAGDDDDRVLVAAVGGRGVAEQRVVDVLDAGGEVADELADLQRERLRADGALQRLLELRRGDHLHRAGDLLDVAHRLAALHDGASLGHGGSVVRSVCGRSSCKRRGSRPADAGS